MKFILKNIIAIICSIIIIGVALNINKISHFIVNHLYMTNNIVIPDANEYKKKDEYLYIQSSRDYIPLSYGDILNIYYSITNNGFKEFTFYCPSEYGNCVNDVSTISNDPEILTYINNFVHPFNGFSNIETTISESGEVNVKVNYLYTEEEINKINDKVNKIYKENITANMSDYDKIKTIHDYIINHTKYDVERNEKGTSKYSSNKANGALLEGYATCSGYTDAMAIFLDKMNIKNYKIATELMQTDITGHVWNAVYLDGKWLHLDLTWDDPVSSSGTDYLQHKYFLITDKELKDIDNSGDIIIKDHIYNGRIYREFKA